MNVDVPLLHHDAVDHRAQALALARNARGLLARNDPLGRREHEGETTSGSPLAQGKPVESVDIKKADAHTFHRLGDGCKKGSRKKGWVILSEHKWLTSRERRGPFNTSQSISEFIYPERWSLVPTRPSRRRRGVAR